MTGATIGKVKQETAKIKNWKRRKKKGHSALTIAMAMRLLSKDWAPQNVQLTIEIMMIMLMKMMVIVKQKAKKVKTKLNLAMTLQATRRGCQRS